MTPLAAIAGLLILGAVIGLYLRPGTVGWFGAGLVALCFAGGFVGVALKIAALESIFGTAAMVSPFIAVLVTLGSLIGDRLRRRSPAEKAAAEAERAAVPPRRKTFRVLLYAVMAVPALFLGNCIYNEVSQPSGLKTLCEGATTGRPIKAFMDDAARTRYQRRTGGPTGKNDSEWFDREYLRLGKYLAETKQLPGDYSVVFAKPGIGYYACIVVHREGVIQSAWFEDRGG